MLRMYTCIHKMLVMTLNMYPYYGKYGKKPWRLGYSCCNTYKAYHNKNVKWVQNMNTNDIYVCNNNIE